jgi:hypothetical protein
LNYRIISDRITSKQQQVQVYLSMKLNFRKPNTTAVQRARKVLRSPSGVFRTREAIKAGVHSRTLYTLRDQGVLERLGRGMYRFADLPTLGNPDLATVALLKVPKGVISLFPPSPGMR